MKLEELKGLCEKATPGPWELTSYCGDDPYEIGPEVVEAKHPIYPANGKFIAAARTYMPKLITIAKFAALYLDKDTLAHQHCLQAALEALDTE